MIKIYEYTTNKYINEEEIKAGMQLRIEGRISELDELLKSINYETIAEGHETDTVKRVYIEVLSTEIQVKEYMTSKEFKETVRRAESFGTINGIEFETLELKAIVWHGDGLFSDMSLVNENNDTLLDIAFIDGKDLSRILDNKENTNNILKAAKKALVKYKKWCENFGIKINEIQEENC